MFEALATEIDELSIPLDGASLAAAIALRDRLGAKIAEAVAEFDSSELWDVDAATSMTAWLRDRADMSHRSAHRLALTARRVAPLPATRAAWLDGSLSGGQVEAMVTVLGSSTIELFADHEAELVPTLAELSTTDTAAAMRVWKAHATAEGKPPAEPERALYLSRVLDGRRILDGDFDPEGGAVVERALRLVESPDVEGEPARLPARRRADALVDLCEFFLTWQQTRRGGRHRPHLNVVVDLGALEAGGAGQVVDGPYLDGPSIDRLLCDSALHRVLMSGKSMILDYGRATRTIPAPLWNALVIRDQHCRWPECDRGPEWCDAHHVTPFSEGGQTSLDNLTLECRRHHHRLHMPSWEAKLKPDGTFEVTDPNGVVRATRPPGTLFHQS